VSLIQKSKTKHLLMKTKFPFEHVVSNDTKEVWVKCDSAITAMGIPALVEKYYPGYKGHIGSAEYLNKLRNRQVQS
jgi:hypothetical protein